MLSGLSTLDIPHIQIQTLAEANEFIRSYGYDVNKQEDLAKLWSYHQKAINYIRNEILQRL